MIRHVWDNTPNGNYRCRACRYTLTIDQMAFSTLSRTPCTPPLPPKHWWAEAILPSARRNP